MEINGRYRQEGKMVTTWRAKRLGTGPAVRTALTAAAEVQDLLTGLSPVVSSVNDQASAAACFHDRAVLALFLTGAGLQGMLPASLSALTALEVLLLDYNPQLTGTWSQDLVLPRLKVLRVEQHQIARVKSQNMSSGLDSWKCVLPSDSPTAPTPPAVRSDAFSNVDKALTGALSGSLLLLGLAYGLYRVYRKLHEGEDDTAALHAHAAAGALLAKKSRFPGLPSVALAQGRGMLAVADVIVTWVVTDVVGSTQLWEWNAAVMNQAIEQHNQVLRRLLDEHGGHEVCTNGDSFTFAFHDAADAVAYCIRAQEQLLEAPWPAQLLQHPYCAAVHLGAACAVSNPEAAAALSASGKWLEDEGPVILAGLRVRMGINTGSPDDVFVHDLTEHVEYRGEEYSLTDDIAGIAAGGQILMGPKTFQRWNKVYTPEILPAVLAEDDCLQHVDRSGEFAMPLSQPLPTLWLDHEHSEQHFSIRRRSIDSNRSLPRLAAAGYTGRQQGNFSQDGTGSTSHTGHATLKRQSMQQAASTPRISEEEMLVLHPNHQLPTFKRSSLRIDPSSGSRRVSLQSPRVNPSNALGSSAGHAVHHFLQSGSSRQTPLVEPSAPVLHKVLFDRLPFLRQQQQQQGNQQHTTEPDRRCTVDHMPDHATSDMHQIGSQPVGEAAEQSEDSGWSTATNDDSNTRRSVQEWQRQLQHDFVNDMHPPAQRGLRASISFQWPQRAGLGSQFGSRKSSWSTMIEGAASFISLAASATSGLLMRRDRLQSASTAEAPRGAPTQRPSNFSLWGGWRGPPASPNPAGQPGGWSAPAAGGLPSEWSAHQAVLLDLGYYQWKPDAPDPLVVVPEGSPASYSELHTEEAVVAEGGLLHLVQIQSQRLAPRMLLFDWPLKASEGAGALLQQFLPGFQDAPGASSVCFQPMQELLDSFGAPAISKPSLAIIFVAPEGIKEVQVACGAQVAQACRVLFTSIVREVLLAMGGYESKEVDGQFMASFHGAQQALEWSLALQCALLQAPWPPEIAELQIAATVAKKQQISGQHIEQDTQGALITEQHASCTSLHKQYSAGQASAHSTMEAGHVSVEACLNAGNCRSSNGSGSGSGNSPFYRPLDIFHGIRARIGMWAGLIDRVAPNGKSGRADYLGGPANKAARLMGAARGGQILAEEATMLHVLEEWQSLQEFNKSRQTSALPFRDSMDEGASHSTAGIEVPLQRPLPLLFDLPALPVRPRTPLFAAVVDSAAFVSPAADALSPLGSLRPQAPTRMRRRSTGEPDVRQLAGCKTVTELGGLATAANLVVQVPAAGQSHVSQVLTIMPAAYQPRRSSRQTTEDTVGYAWNMPF
eukprot:gene12225-12363_t